MGDGSEDPSADGDTAGDDGVADSKGADGDDAGMDDAIDGDNDYNAADGEADTYEVGVVTGEILL